MERPILFSGGMVRGILDGRKRQTRRVVKPQFNCDADPAERSKTSPEGYQTSGHSGEWFDEVIGPQEFVRCPYGVPGDLLWVREEFSGPHELSTVRPGLWDVVAVPPPPIWYWADGEPGFGDWTRPKPSIHMPKWASRLTLRITEVRVERLNEISEADARAEGITVLPLQDPDDPSAWWEVEPGQCQARSPDASYRLLWESINGRGSWDANPWVWVVEFERVG